MPTSSSSARSTVSLEPLCSRLASSARPGMRCPAVWPYRSRTAYSRQAQSLIGASMLHSGDDREPLLKDERPLVAGPEAARLARRM